ncbi:hypothetical protein A2U01_0074793, partial [Trifolium medium]|nr:hypothetical protein [Trifolium medium]
GVRNKIEVEFCLSPSNRWAVGTNDTIFGGLVEGLSIGTRRKLGFMLTID